VVVVVLVVSARAAPNPTQKLTTRRGMMDAKRRGQFIGVAPPPSEDDEAGTVGRPRCVDSFNPGGLSRIIPGGQTS
jgi:hypothetical protein